MNRRHFIQASGVGALSLAAHNVLAQKQVKPQNIQLPKAYGPGSDDRLYWSQLFYKIAEPVLSNMSQGQLHQQMQMDVGPGWSKNGKKEVGYLEAFGRLTAGLSLWLNLPDDGSFEGKQRKQLREWTIASLVHAVDPKSPDYLAWSLGPQPLVDAAYLAHGLLRSSKTLWEPLDSTTKQRIIKEFKDLRRVKPAYNNWLLFAAMTETFLLYIGEQADPLRIEFAIRKINEWYAGDGWYADGPVFGMDYYNGFAIHSMLLQVCDVWVKQQQKLPISFYNNALQRMQRYAEFLERIISPEGSYPPFGRSITYRIGAFQPLVELAYMHQLPDGVSLAQVRCAMTAVMTRMFSFPDTFDENNFLRLGFVGYQPNIADYYTNTGSLYLTSLGFLPLGLPASDPFWTDEAADWTAKKAWKGDDFKKDYAVQY